MTDGWIAVPQDSNGKRLRTDYNTTGGGTTVHTEYVRADHSTIVASNASFAVAVPGIVRVQNLTAASFLVSASITPASYQKVLNATYASFLAQASVPGYVRVLNATAASFLVSATLTPASYQKVLNATYASFLAQVAVPGSVRVQNATTAASLLAQVNVPGILREATTRGSTVVQADHSLVVATNASFGVNVPGVVRVIGPASTASFVVGTPGYQRVTSNTAASFLLTAKAVSLTAGSFLATVSIPAFVNVKGPTTRGSTVVQADHSLVISTSQASFLVSNPGVQRVSNAITAASFLAQVNVPGFVNIKGPTTRGSTIAQVDHSALISVSAASFLVGDQAKSYSSVWPVAQSTGVYNPFTQDTLGRQVVLMNSTPGRTVATVFGISTVVTGSVFGAVGGNRTYVTDISIANISATAVAVVFYNGQTGANFKTGRQLYYAYVDSADGATGASFATTPFVTHTFNTPIFTNVNATFAVGLSRAVSSTTRVQISASGYQSPV